MSARLTPGTPVTFLLWFRRYFIKIIPIPGLPFFGPAFSVPYFPVLHFWFCILYLDGLAFSGPSFSSFLPITLP